MDQCALFHVKIINKTTVLSSWLKRKQWKTGEVLLVTKKAGPLCCIFGLHEKLDLCAAFM